MIELSPYLRCTGTACFNWDREADLLHGRLPLDRADTPTADLASSGRRGPIYFFIPHLSRIC
jgi:hypothetical protein